jgi:ATP-dependent DNA helicase RecG
MKIIDTILRDLNDCLDTHTFTSFETDKVELKDLSGGTDWKELYKSVCAFLNAQGGIVIIGVKEDSKKSVYHFRGFNLNNENKLKELPKQFTDDSRHPLDLTDYIRPDLFEIREFREGHVCIVYVEKLPDDKKFVLYDGEAFVRRLTGDHKLRKDEIDRQKELRAELAFVRELHPVNAATLDDLDVNKLNDFIHRLNQGMNIETIKPSIADAQSFLSGRKFVIHNQPTLLGMLVCGKRIYEFLESRCQVDCFVTSPVQIASNKKAYKDNIIALLEQSISFVFANIATGVRAEKGGTATFEYPEDLIREMVNNALAHRDYSINRFVNITISPNERIEIRNPGRFRQEQLIHSDDTVPIRRIIPIPKAQNPRLADVLKTFDRWEGRGRGMSSLTNMALDNHIDVPYFIFYAEQDVGLHIPKGNVLDQEMDWWFKSFEGYIFTKTNGRDLTDEQRTALAYFFKSERLNQDERYTIALTPDNNHFSAIKDLTAFDLIQKHTSSPQLHPIYLVDRTLTRFDFTDELRATFGGSYDNLTRDLKDVLTVVYHFNRFGKSIKDTSASQVGNILYFRQHRTDSDARLYNDFKRKIRRLINLLTKDRFLTKHGDGVKSRYTLNDAFHRTPSLFD